MKNAKGVMIFPDIIKAALFIGGEGGSGVLMAKQPNGAWSYPAFYTMGSVSFGFQAGGQS
jgi:lipid-binding SYLF domain-containing protein